MKFRLRQKINPLNIDAQIRKFYAVPVNAGKLTIKDFAAEIAGRSSLTQGDIESVLRNFLEQLPVFLKIGMSVQLGDFGTMRLGLSSEGTETEEEFNAANIKSVRIIFTPGVELKNSLKNISLTRVD